DASHAADATGRRAFSCPGMGRVLSQCAEEPGTFVSPARSVPQESAISAPSIILEWKIVSSVHLK
ncbi:MAG: hypothetical protein L0G95_10200, partial [Planococcus sp. (in: firmicutes)]|nr:hypothetical protein [Planococcus sp. (in: firmicutes)]